MEAFQLRAMVILDYGCCLKFAVTDSKDGDNVFQSFKSFVKKQILQRFVLKHFVHNKKLLTRAVLLDYYS